MMRRVLTCVLLLGVLSTTEPRAAAPPPWLTEVIEDRAEAHGVSAAWVTSTVGCETGQTWNVYAVGKLGELGLAQLAPFGLLPHFYRVGYSDPFDAWQSLDYLSRAFSGEWRSAGVGPWHWSCA